MGGGEGLAFVGVGEGGDVGVGEVGDVVEAEFFAGFVKMHKY